jgi:hypothetical protein
MYKDQLNSGVEIYIDMINRNPFLKESKHKKRPFHS